MKAILTISLLLCSILAMGASPDSVKTQRLEEAFQCYVDGVYECLGDTSLSKDALEDGIKGYWNLKLEGKVKVDGILTLIDFTQHSSRERLYVIDLDNHCILYKRLCAHGKRSGGAIATHFSNEHRSHMSSLGFYLTDGTYTGKFDLALRINGLERSNSNARSRGVVMHGADYASKEFLESNGGVLGRSFGCPALPKEGFGEVVDQIKGGSCLFIYHDTRHYRSRILREQNYLQLFDVSVNEELSCVSAQ